MGLTRATFPFILLPPMSRLLVAAVALVLTAAAARPESVRWSLADASARAVERNLTLKQRQIDTAARREAFESSWNLYVPGIEASVALKRIESADPPWALWGGIEVVLGLDRTLADQVARSRQSWEAGVIAYDQARLQLMRDLEKTFYQVLLVEQRIRLAEQNAQLAALQYERTVKLYDAGQASDLDLLAARVGRENTLPELLSLRNSLESLRTQLKQLTGLAAEDELALTGEIGLPKADLDRTRLLQEAQASSPSVRKLRADLEALVIGRRISARQSRTPSLSLGYSWAPRVVGPIADTIGDPASYRDRGTLTLGVTAPLDPLIPHSKDDQRIRGLDAGIEQARVILDQALYTSRLEVANFLNQLAGIEQTLRARELAERQAQEVYTQTLTAYDKGQRELLDVQDAQARLQEARLAILNEKYNYIAALADLEFAVGTRLIKE